MRASKTLMSSIGECRLKLAKLRAEQLWIFYGILLLYPLSLLSAYKLFYIYVFMCFVVFVGALCKYPRYVDRIIVNGWPVLGLFFLFYLSSIWAIKPDVALEASSVIAIFAVVFLLFCCVNVTASPVNMSRIFVYLPLLFLALNMAVLFVYGAVRPTYESKEAIGSYSNFMSASVVGCLPYILFYIRFGRHKLLGYIGLVASLFDIIISGSRGGWLCFVVFFGVLLPTYHFRNGRQILKYYARESAVVAFVVVLLWQFDVTREIFVQTVTRFTDLIPEGKLPGLGQLIDVRDLETRRELMYFFGVHLIYEHPWVGVGFGNFMYLMFQAYGEMAIVPHNFVLELWNSCGVFGLGLFAYILVRACRKGKVQYMLNRGSRPDIAYWVAANVSGLVLLLLGGMFRPLFTNPMVYFCLSSLLLLPNYRNLTGRWLWLPKRNTDRFHGCEKGAS